MFQPSVIKVGDRLRYWAYPCTVGDPERLRTDIVTAVVRDKYPIHFQHGCPYHPDGLMKKIPPGYSTPTRSGDDSDDESRTTDIKFRILSDYQLVYGGSGKACARVVNDAATLKDFAEHVTEKTIARAGGMMCKDVFNYRRAR